MEDELRGKTLYPDEPAKDGRYRWPVLRYLGLILIVVGVIITLVLFVGGPLLGLPGNTVFLLLVLFGVTLPLSGLGLMVIGIASKPIRLYEKGLDHIETSEFIPWEKIERVEIFGERSKASNRTIKFSYSGGLKCKMRIYDMTAAKRITDIFSKMIPDKIFKDSQPDFTSKVRIY
jgi:hypothetical protein